jgi:hypothetical protein
LYLGCGVRVLEMGVQLEQRFSSQGSGCRVQGSGFRGLEVKGIGSRLKDSEFRI